MTRKMKDSGVEWIGEIPEDWGIVKLKSITKNHYSGGTPTASKEEFYSEDNIKGFPFVNISDITNQRYITTTAKNITIKGIENKNLKLVPKGSLLYAMYASVGKLSVSQIDLYISQAILAFGATEKADKRYLVYYLNSLESFVDYFSSGTTQMNLNAEIVKNFKVVIPSLKIQQKSISDFLNKKTQEIDNIISKTKKALEEYIKYKQSLITETVTKGLDENVEMKDSGIEWIGEIPEHWDVSKIKYFYNITLGKMLQPRQRNNDESKEYYISAINIQDDVDLSIEKQMWFSKNEKSMYKIEKGDLLTVEGGHAGKSILWEYSNLDKEYYFQNSILRARNKFNSDNRFLKYWMQSLRGVGYLDYICNKATIAHFTREKYLNTEIVVLDYKEQEQIASYLDEKTNQIDQIISTKEKLLREMEAYKKSLIYETVTGKREVK